MLFITVSVFGQVADDPVRNRLERRMAQQVAGEQAARLDAVGLEEPDDVGAREAGVVPHRDDEPEPGRLRVRRRPRQEQPVLVRAQRVHQPIEVGAARAR